jgi:quinoprotein glucose dehydrogenase
LFTNSNNLFSISHMHRTPEGSSERFEREFPDRGDTFFWDSDQVPCQQPPWGLLTAIDVAKGSFVWQTSLNTVNIGGSIVTEGNLVFLGATTDNQFRAFDSRSGLELWSSSLPASAHATPITYLGPTTGKQFIAISAGGGGFFRGKVSDAVVAFALEH